MKLHQKLVASVALAAASVPAFAVSLVDYSAIMSQVTTELTAGIVAAAAGIGMIWGARVGVRFVRSLLH